MRDKLIAGFDWLHDRVPPIRWAEHFVLWLDEGQRCWTGRCRKA